MPQPLDKFQEGLNLNKLSSVKGSAFDNAFNVFLQPKEKNNLVVLGTNGNITDAVRTNSEWLCERARNPAYCHVRSGNWGNSPLQAEIKRLPEVFNSCFGERIFSYENMIVTNALLLASSGVGDIRNQFEKLRASDSSFNNLQDLVRASIKFLTDYTLSYAKPKVIFAYGNSEPGDSAWRYLRQNHRILKEGVPIQKTKSTCYKFCVLEINGDEIPIVGSPHLSYHYNKPDRILLTQGLKGLGVV